MSGRGKPEQPRILVLRNGFANELNFLGRQGPLEIEAQDWWGHQWRTNVTLQRGESIQLDFDLTWTAALPMRPMPSDWVAEAARLSGLRDTYYYGNLQRIGKGPTPIQNWTHSRK